MPLPRPVLSAALVMLLVVTATASPAGAVLAPPAPAAVSTTTTDPVGEWPLRPEPEVVGAFDPPDSAYLPGHRGVDLAGRVGQQVRAALAGRITFAGSLAGRGVVVVDHGATRTTYEPVATSVAVGSSLAAGDPVGTLQAAGSHCFPSACLHWGWIDGDTYLDPLRLVGLGPVRLLPLWRVSPVARSPVSARATGSSPYAGWTPPVAHPR